MIDAGVLKERVEFLMAKKSTNEYGEQLTNWAVYYSCRAAVKFQKGLRALQEGEIFLPHTIMITIRKTNVVSEKLRVKWNENIYLIEALNSQAGDGTSYITATRLEEGE